MIASHLNAIEKVLIAQSEIANNAGHPNLRGGPREWFIHEYLENHLPTILEIGQGEIIDENSEANPSQNNYRPQVDLIIYRRDLPKIVYSKYNSAFLAEGVKATFEIKSELTKKDLNQACNASKIHKSLNRSIKKGIISYLVAFSGPSNMSTVAGWLKSLKSPDDAVDMIIILGKGIAWRINAFPEFPIKDYEDKNWAYFDSTENNLYAMFIHMLTWVTLTSEEPDISNYASHFYYEEVELI